MSSLDATRKRCKKLYQKVPDKTAPAFGVNDMKDALDKIDLVAGRLARAEEGIQRLEQQLVVALEDVELHKANSVMHENRAHMFMKQAVDNLHEAMKPKEETDKDLAAENAVLIKRLPSMVMGVAIEITEGTKKMLAAHTVATLASSHRVQLDYADSDDCAAWDKAMVEFTGGTKK